MDSFECCIPYFPEYVAAPTRWQNVLLCEKTFLQPNDKYAVLRELGIRNLCYDKYSNDNYNPTVTITDQQ